MTLRKAKALERDMNCVAAAGSVGTNPTGIALNSAGHSAVPNNGPHPSKEFTKKALRARAISKQPF